MSYNPMRGEAAQKRPRVWIAYDDAASYFAFRCLDTSRTASAAHQPPRQRVERRLGGGQPRFEHAPAKWRTTCSSTRAASRWTRCRAAARRRLRARLGVAERRPRRRRRMVGRDARAARKHPLPGRHRRADGRAVLPPQQPHRRRVPRGPRWRRANGCSTPTPRWCSIRLQSPRLLEVIPSATISTQSDAPAGSSWKVDPARKGDFGVSVNTA